MVDQWLDRRMEQDSDDLLAESIREHGRGEYPCYSGRWMELLAGRETGGVEYEPGAGGEIEAMLGGMVVDANLTRKQRMVVRWVVRGVSQREIARMMGLSEAQVSRIRSAAIERLRREGLV